MAAGSTRRRPMSAVAVGLLVCGASLVACTGDDEPEDASDRVALVTGTPLYLTDGNLGASTIGKLAAGSVTGAVGTVPGAQVSDEFRTLIGADPAAPGKAYSYAPESYDSVVLTALAMQEAQTDAVAEVAAAMPAVSADGEACASFAECSDLLRQGVDIDYNGVSGPVELDEHGGVTSGTIGLFEYDDQNQVPGYTAAASSELPADFVDGDVPEPVGAAPVAGGVVGPAPDGQLVIGALVPTSGQLRGFGRPIKAAVTAAVAEINDAGGVLGREVLLSVEDAADDTAEGQVIAEASVTSLLADSTDVVVSAASSGTTLELLDQVVGAGVMMVSSAATAPTLATASDSGLFFRLAPSDVLQAEVLSQRIIDDGATQVAVVARNDAYGRGLSQLVADNLTDSGAEMVADVKYPVDRPDFGRAIEALTAASPDAVVVIGFEESSALIEQLTAAGLGPQS